MLAASGPLLDEFIRSSEASAMLIGVNGQLADTDVLPTVQMPHGESSATLTVASRDPTITYTTDSAQTDDAATVIMSEQATITAEVSCADQEERCIFYVTPRVEAKNMAVRALGQRPDRPTAAGILPPLRPGLFPLYYLTDRPPQQHWRKDGGSGF